MNDYRAYIECGYNDIYHHGVPGMKWGERNGPPYPLNYNWTAYNKKRETGKTGTRKSPKSFSESANNALSKTKKKAQSIIQEKQDEIKQKKLEKEKKKKEKEDLKAERREKYSKLKGTQKFKEFVKDHKKEIAIGAAVVAGTVLAIYGHKKRDAINAAINKKYREQVDKTVKKMFDEYKVKRADLEAQTGGYGKGKTYQDLMKEYDYAESYIGKRVANMGPGKDSIWRNADYLGRTKGNNINEKLRTFRSDYTFGILPRIEALEKQLGPDDKRVKNLKNLGDILQDVSHKSGQKVGMASSNRGYTDEQMESIFKLFELEAKKIANQAEREVEEFKSSGRWDSAVAARERGNEFASKLYEAGLGNTSMANKNYRNAFTAAVGRGKDYFEDLLMKDIYRDFLRMLEEDILMHNVTIGKKWLLNHITS